MHYNNYRETEATILSTMLNQECAFCKLQADRKCPIAGKQICSTTCLEISTWADEVLSDEDSVYLEFIEEVRTNSKLNLDLCSDVEVADKCNECKYHWTDAE